MSDIIAFIIESLITIENHYSLIRLYTVFSLIISFLIVISSDKYSKLLLFVFFLIFLKFLNQEITQMQEDIYYLLKLPEMNISQWEFNILMKTIFDIEIKAIKIQLQLRILAVLNFFNILIEHVK